LRIGIVGAGVAGLAAARTLQAGAKDVVVFEKADRLGGRILTRRLGDYVFDAGATSIAPRGLAIEKVMLEELDGQGLVRLQRPIYLHQNLRVVPGDIDKNATPRYVYAQGIGRLPELLAEGLDVRLQHGIDEIKAVGAGFSLGEEEFDALVLTPPVPQSAALLWSLGESRATANCRYRPCLSVLLGYEHEPPGAAYHALLDAEQRHPLVWLSIESLKSGGRAPQGCTSFVAQMNPMFSTTNFDKTDARIVGAAVEYVRRLYGDEWGEPAVADVVRWKYSQPDSTAFFDSVNPPGSKVVLAGDGVVGGRVEQAFESGVRAARLLMEKR
jgi:renalase